MELNDVKYLALRLMNRHGLITKGWNFAFDNARRRLGLCSHRKKIISLSKYYIPLVDIEEINDTILHEIAHALVGSKNGHNHFWKQKAIEIGCNGKSHYHGEARVEPKYIGTCPKCGRTISRHRRKRISFGKCSFVFDATSLFIWKLNEC